MVDKIQDRGNPEALKEKYDVVLVGSGIGSLTAACMLTHNGLKCLVVEANYLPGGCVSTYYRKGFLFEAGATTLVGLDEYMPVRHLLDTVGIDIDAWKLEVPMKVHLANGEILTRYQDLNEWIVEAERVFGKQGQREFWELCYEISQSVWQTSSKQLTFPPSKVSDLWPMAVNVSVEQVKSLPNAFRSVKDVLKKYGLDKNELFTAFVDEQLMITAQNTNQEVNMLFGAAALCYTNYTNWYMPGGLINLIWPLIEYLRKNGSDYISRNPIERIKEEGGTYTLSTRLGDIKTQQFISGIPINNTLELFKDGQLSKKLNGSIMGSEKLNSAFQMGIGFNSDRNFDCIHHQIHLEEPLPQIGSRSIFLSLSHPKDDLRSEPGQAVGSISTHLPDPANTKITDKEEIENAIIAVLEEKGFLKKEDIVYQHSSGAASWQTWTRRKFGFVGGYPQFMNIKPWQMLDSRLDGKGAYICGDTTYPGQGIPGAALSGLIAANKLLRDHY